MTILLYPDIPPVKAPQLTLIMAIAVAEGIQEVTGLETKIKWPNDIVVNGKENLWYSDRDEYRDRLHQSCRDRCRNQCESGYISG